VSTRCRSDTFRTSQNEHLAGRLKSREIQIIRDPPDLGNACCAGSRAAPRTPRPAVRIGGPLNSAVGDLFRRLPRAIHVSQHPVAGSPAARRKPPVRGYTARIALKGIVGSGVHRRVPPQSLQMATREPTLPVTDQAFRHNRGDDGNSRWQPCASRLSTPEESPIRGRTQSQRRGALEKANSDRNRCFGALCHSASRRCHWLSFFAKPD
jgi:hypothetical protein